MRQKSTLNVDCPLWEQQLAIISEERAAIAKQIDKIAWMPSRAEELEGYMRIIEGLNASAIRLALLHPNAAPVVNSDN